MSQDTDSEDGFESADEGETAQSDLPEKFHTLETKLTSRSQVGQSTNEDVLSAKRDISTSPSKTTDDQKHCDTTELGIDELKSGVKDVILNELEKEHKLPDKKSETSEHPLESTYKDDSVVAKQPTIPEKFPQTFSLERKQSSPTVLNENCSQDNKSETVDVASEATAKKGKVLLLKEKRELERGTKSETVSNLPKTASTLTSNPSEEKSSHGWGMVGGWSSSFLSSVASSASTFTSHVTQGIGSVLETVEASLGAPSPEELAASRKAEKEKIPEGTDPHTPVQEDETVTPGSAGPEIGQAVGGLFGGVSAFTRVLESTGSKVISGSLDTLELIGKKTMDILTEGDPGLRKKRTLFGGPETTLSQVLRDAKNKSQDDNSFLEDTSSDSLTVHYSKLFDEFQGLVHLEALEILSGRSKCQLEEQLLMMGPDAEPLHHTLQELRDTCLNLPPTDDTPDDETKQDFEKLMNEHMSALTLNLNIDKIKSIQAATENWVLTCKRQQDQGTVRDPKEIYVKVITALAELTARAMELFHKMTELVLVAGSSLEELRKFAQHFTGLIAVLCTEVAILSSQFCHCLSTAADDSEDPDSVNPLITNVYLEASNSNTYIQDAFQLLIPVFQEIAARTQNSKNGKY